jgi:hypothetical protein
MNVICRLLQVDKLRTTSYKASTNAAVERFHKTLNGMLGRVIADDQRDWDVWLPYVVSAYRSSRHESTQYSPNFLTLGREVRAPVDLMFGTGDPATLPTAKNYDVYADEVARRFEVAYRLVRQQLGTTALRTKHYYDLRVRPATYNVGATKGGWKNGSENLLRYT